MWQHAPVLQCHITSAPCCSQMPTGLTSQQIHAAQEVISSLLWMQTVRDVLADVSGEICIVHAWLSNQLHPVAPLG
jgi:hypothetical protein